MTQRHLLATGLVLAGLTFSPAGAETMDGDMAALENRLKAFAYQWFARIDDGADMDAILPYISEESISFATPSNSFTTVDELRVFWEGFSAQTVASAHYLDDVTVTAGSEVNTYDILTPHRFHAQLPDGGFYQLGAYSSMRVRVGDDLRLSAYASMIPQTPSGSSDAAIHAINFGDFDTNDVKAFIHNWYALTDEEDVAGLME